MLISLLPARLHGWLDDLASLSYLAAALFLGFEGAALALVLLGAMVHLLNTRLTDYPQGSIKVYPLRVHAYIELCEGAAMLAGAVGLSALSTWQHAALYLFGLSQIGAALTSDLTPPVARASLAPKLPGA
jgi:hypothetical protein